MWRSVHATHETAGSINLRDKQWIPLVYEGVEAGENEQRHHGAQRHHVVKL